MEDISEIHKLEPYVYSQMVAGRNAVNHGQAKNSWLTGTASWNFVAISQSILGIKPAFDGLEIDPCISEEIKEYVVYRKFRGTEFEIHVKNGVGSYSLSVDGKEVAGKVLMLFDGAKHMVECTV